MPIVRSVVTFEHATAIPERRMQNTFHFGIPVGPVEPADYAAIGAALDNFYSGVTGATPAVDEFLSEGQLHANLPTVDHYLVAPGGVTGAPEGFSELLGFTPNPQSALPLEVTVCLSFHADLTGLSESVPLPPVGPAGDSHPRARNRGRVYIPALNINANANGVVDPVLVTSLVNAGTRLRDSATLSARGIRWGIYSRVNDFCSDVEAGWVDNAFDTQRRRGHTALARTTW